MFSATCHLCLRRPSDMCRDLLTHYNTARFESVLLSVVAKCSAASDAAGGRLVRFIFYTRRSPSYTPCSHSFSCAPPSLSFCFVSSRFGPKSLADANHTTQDHAHILRESSHSRFDVYGRTRSATKLCVCDLNSKHEHDSPASHQIIKCKYNHVGHF